MSHRPKRRLSVFLAARRCDSPVLGTDGVERVPTRERWSRESPDQGTDGVERVPSWEQME